MRPGAVPQAEPAVMFSLPLYRVSKGQARFDRNFGVLAC
jgi:hypothetical protein